ncbi:MAG: nuclear transport factor 2 family protein [Acidimicrobiales bacterium]|jgi:limonene-1,2-epoxide hydrolase|nr:nuclear transport factor 2 family protein [Acidimicrobiales bacterium]
MSNDATTPAADAERVVDEFIALVVAKRLDDAFELVADDVEYDNVPMGKVFGPDGIRSVLGPMIDGIEEAEWVVHRQVARDGVVLNERTDRFRVGERWIELPVAGVFVVGGDGRISLWRDYFDAGQLNEQLAAVLG